MYESHFGFREKPFSVTPDPRFFYANRAYREALATLVYAVQERRGFALLTGEVGTGKTTVVRRALEDLEPDVRCQYFYHTMLGFDDLVRVMCEEFRVPGAEGPLVTRLLRLNEWLIAELEAGRAVALLVDEAQNLGDETLEQLRLLSNLETSRAKLLQIVLVGQPELEAKLARPHLRQLRQRLAVQCRLGPLADADEVQRFIDYRLAQVGYTGRRLFTADAVALLTAASRGVPRLVNLLGDNALLLTFAAGARRVTGDTVIEAVEDLGLVPPSSSRHPVATGEPASATHRSRWWRRAGLATAAVGVGAALAAALTLVPPAPGAHLAAVAGAAGARAGERLLGISLPFAAPAGARTAAPADLAPPPAVAPAGERGPLAAMELVLARIRGARRLAPEGPIERGQGRPPGE